MTPRRQRRGVCASPFFFQTKVAPAAFIQVNADEEEAKQKWNTPRYRALFGQKGCQQLDWDFLFTTDPEFLSDGYRVQFIQLVYEKDGQETVREMMVEHANMGNG